MAEFNLRTALTLNRTSWFIRQV